MKGQCNTGNCQSYGRNFMTKEEKIEHLEEYHKMLQNEAKGVEERIAELKS